MRATITRGLRLGTALLSAGALVAACTQAAAPAPTFTIAPAPAAAASPPTVASAPSPADPSPMMSMGPMASPPAAAATPLASPLSFVAGTKNNPRVIKIVTDDQLQFTPAVVFVAPGETIKFQVTDKGTAEHEFKVGPLADVFADKESAPEVAGILTGKTKSLTYTFNGSGPFAFACHAPGHFEHGMKGYVIVVDPHATKLGTKTDPRLVWIDMNDQLKFVPSTISVTKGETVSFILTNSGTATHEFQVGPADLVAEDKVDGKIDVEVDELGAGSVHAITYTFTGSGPYGFACHEPGHFEAGMAGTITVIGS